MPGIFGLAWGKTPCEGCERLLDRMAESMRHHGWYRETRQLDETAGVALGRMALGFIHPEPQPVRLEEGTLVGVCDGEILNAEQQREQLHRRGVRFQTTSPAELLLRGYREQGITFFSGLAGKFVAALWDGARGQLLLVNDRFGMRPLFYAQPGNRLIFASEVKALLLDEEISRRPNLTAIAQFFSYGQLLGEETMYESVRLLPAATALVYDVTKGELQLHRYWRLEEQARQTTRSRQEALERIVSAFDQAVERCTQGEYSLGLSLSGGLDARTILGVVRPDRPLTTLCMGVPGSMDLRCAAEMARSTNRPHHEVILDERFLSHFAEHLRNMVRLTDGQYLSQCIVMPTLPVYRQLGIEVLLRGHAGELMHLSKAYNFSFDAEVQAADNDAAVERWLGRRLQAYMLEGTNGELFAGPRGQMEELARTSLRASLRPLQGISPPAQQVSRLFLSMRLRRETATSLVKFGSVVETRLPYLDNDVVDALMQAPVDLKLDEEIQAEILRRRCPALLRVLNVNTGARMEAGALARQLGKLKQKVLAKLGVKGYQPYEKLGLWLRRELRPLVQNLLLDPRCLERGIFRPEAVREVVERHLSNRANHTFLILAMMIFETGQRMFVDGETAEIRTSSGTSFSSV